MPDIIATFNRTESGEYTSYGKLSYAVSYTDDLALKKTTAKITLKFYIKPDSYTYTSYTKDTLYLGLRKGSSTADLTKKTLATHTLGGTVSGGVYNLVGQADFTVAYQSTAAYPVYLAAGYTNQSTSRFAPFTMPRADGSGFVSYSYNSTQANKIVLEKRINQTPCTPPTAVSFNKAVYEGNATLEWAGAKGGEGNPITGYDVQYRTSADKAVWTAWKDLGTVKVSPFTANPTVPAGHFVQAQVRTRGQAGSGYFSSFKLGAVVQKKPEACTPPVFIFTEFIGAKLTFDDKITLKWKGATGKTNNKIKGYEIQYAVGKNYVFGSFKNLVTLSTSKTEGSYIYNPEIQRGDQIMYQIRTLGSASYHSGFGKPLMYVRNMLPSTPYDIIAESTLVKLGQGVSMFWGMDRDDNFLHYIVEVCKNGGAYVRFAEAISPLGYAIITDKPGTTLRFRVKAVDRFLKESGYGYSQIIRVNTAPSAPTGLSVSPKLFGNTDKLEIKFNKAQDLDNNVEKYQLAIKKGNSYQIFATCNSPAYTHTVGAEFPESQGVQLCVRAVDTLGECSPYTILNETLTKIDNTLSLGIGEEWVKKRVYFGENGKWIPRGIYKGVGEKWVKSAAINNNHKPVVQEKAVKGSSFTVSNTFEGSAIKGQLVPVGVENEITLENPSITAENSGNTYSLTLPVSLRAFKTTVNPNYTDSTGQQWRTDYYCVQSGRVFISVSQDFEEIAEREITPDLLDFPPELRGLRGSTSFSSNGQLSLKVPVFEGGTP